MKLILQPESVDESTADASRKAYRAYAKSIETEHPEEAKELFDYVRELDKTDVENKRRGRTINTAKNIEFTKQLILALLNMDSCTKEELHHVFENTGYTKYQKYLWHALKNLTGEHKIRLVKQTYELIQDEN